MKVGDTVIRYMRVLHAFHYGVVVEIDSENILKSMIVDFNVDDYVHFYNFEEFLLGEKVFWIANWASEPEHIKQSQRSPEEIAKMALDIMLDIANEGTAIDVYSVDRNNCEHFVRRCTFRHPDAIVSRQMDHITANQQLTWCRIGIAAISGAVMSRRQNQTDRIPQRSPLDADRFRIKNDRIVPFPT